MFRAYPSSRVAHAVELEETNCNSFPESMRDMLESERAKEERQGITAGPIRIAIRAELEFVRSHATYMIIPARARSGVGAGLRYIC